MARRRITVADDAEILVLRNPIELGDLRARIYEAFAAQRAHAERFAEPARAAHTPRAWKLIREIKRLEKVPRA